MSSVNPNEVFRGIQEKTQCPFAKKAEITFARVIPENYTMHDASVQLHEDIAGYVKEGISEAPDGLAVAIPNSVIGTDFDTITDGFNDLYRSLKLQDGYDESDLDGEVIEDPDWQLTIAGGRLFTNVFSSLYPESNSRHVPEPGLTILFFQPEQSFSDRIPFDIGSAGLKRLKDGIRKRFDDAGLGYEPSIVDSPWEADKYILPSSIGAEAVRWWQ